MKNIFGYRGVGNDRYVKPDTNGQVVNPYDLDSRLFQELAQTKRLPYFVQTLDLRTANSLSLPKNGFHFVCYGHDGSATKTVNTTILVNVWANTINNTGDAPFPAKHARGFSGPFSGLYLEWSAQANAYADFIIFMNPDTPWLDGESCT